jgi:hypothetical protein
MPYIMPTVNITNLQSFDQKLLVGLIDHHSCLVTCPPNNSTRTQKVIHHVILRSLYKDSRWITPLPGAWYTPHIEGLHTGYTIPDHELRAAVRIVAHLHYMGCFGAGIPQLIDKDKGVYEITQKDGSTFQLMSKHK